MEISDVKVLDVDFDGVRVPSLVVRLSDGRAFLIPLLNRRSTGNDAQMRQVLQLSDGQSFQIDGRTEMLAFTGTTLAHTQPDKPDNRRSFFRIRRPGIAVEISVDDKNYDWAVAEDISEGGALLVVRAASVISEGQSVFLRVHLPDKELVCCDGIVRRVTTKTSSEYGMSKLLGIHFVRMTPDDRQRLVRYIFRHQLDQTPVR